MSSHLIACFRALSDPTRLAMVERLVRGAASVSELAAPSGLALPTILKHLKALEDGGIVVSTKTGRTRLCTLRPAVLSEAQGWLGRLTAQWEARLNRLDVLALSLDRQEKPE